ncbi:hypothetical protein BMT55_03275 [Listeria newyorkensis]|uniref:DUF2207 domain-containing protein n=2 Tax=Listeriaceae TaxID=186820 RepID=A0ABX4XP11_9LIST|nr:hypothetical protein EP56_12240 [Listeriaceae bacterium FSL A5-0209]KGL44681.1 hypothetical protein EP58_04170 [Listeria newyorkensis]PNP93804.1 hypothetical protein BMT55_03275 [Listeria newyorkensis]RQW67306.1 hypothetical protein DUK53_05990 [Listeria sp. SHR_NRA_18]SQC50797.1 Uncharacterised protein [Listeria newyorkensis]
MDMSGRADFVGYEYKDITINQEQESLFIDGYTNFGWDLDSVSKSVTSLKIKFKRDRKIRNKAELTRLQRQFDACVDEMEQLERSKKTTARIVAYGIALVGTIGMACSVFAVTSGLITLSIIFAIPGVLGWLIPYFSYKKLYQKKTAEITILMDQKNEELYEVSKKANGLLPK